MAADVDQKIKEALTPMRRQMLFPKVYAVSLKGGCIE